MATAVLGFERWGNWRARTVFRGGRRDVERVHISGPNGQPAGLERKAGRKRLGAGAIAHGVGRNRRPHGWDTGLAAHQYGRGFAEYYANVAGAGRLSLLSERLCADGTGHHGDDADWQRPSGPGGSGPMEKDRLYGERRPPGVVDRLRPGGATRGESGRIRIAGRAAECGFGLQGDGSRRRLRECAAFGRRAHHHNHGRQSAFLHGKHYSCKPSLICGERRSPTRRCWCSIACCPTDRRNTGAPTRYPPEVTRMPPASCSIRFSRFKLRPTKVWMEFRASLLCWPTPTRASRRSNDRPVGRARG